MSPTPQDTPLQGIKALTFDVFGTLVSWRPTITSALTSSLLFPQDSPISPTDLANLWRASYGQFVTSYNPVTDPWKDIDTFHHDSLISLLKSHNIPLPTPEGLVPLSKTWHFLPPHPDVPDALKTLTKRYKTATLSNGNTSLLHDLIKLGNLTFTNIISAEDFRAYKPNPKVYLGACEKLGSLNPGEVAMVAAHLGDLQAARSVGLKTVYIERAGEDNWSAEEERYKAAREWVDIWVEEEKGGLQELVRRLGLEEA
ncbi:haloacid dehalogenase [Podospora fimiseda]|uniref:Haloacid dehalogenase n=1 Tax=Podospora fimiseda TaxID=252190 RepID=A0AAN7BSP7_9PEZI|nr:haloacid dehalogenase [Podospora fimiseda]